MCLHPKTNDFLNYNYCFCTFIYLFSVSLFREKMSFIKCCLLAIIIFYDCNNDNSATAKVMKLFENTGITGAEKNLLVIPMLY